MVKSVAKIGLFGGSFDPIHNGHLQLATWTEEKLALDRIIFIPAAIPPHKQHLSLTSAIHRKQMIQLAIANHKKFVMSDVEIRRKGISYTIDTLLYFKIKFNLDQEHLLLLIGADNIIYFKSWKDPEKILANCKIAVYQRPGIDLTKLDIDIQKQVILLDSPLFPISSSEIRRQLLTGEKIQHLVPTKVINYINQHSLYRLE